MKRIFQILLFLLAFKCHAQTVINNLSLDTLGRLKWNISSPTLNLRIEVQRNLSGNWTTLSKTDYDLGYFDEPPKILPPQTFENLYIVPLEKGENRYRLIITGPTKIETTEISSNSTIKKNEIYATDGFIRFDNRVNFSINDSNGNEIRKLDNGRMIKIADLKADLYYIIADRNIYEFVKK